MQVFKQQRLFIVFVLTSVLFLTIVGPASAATYTVTNINDNGPNSFRQAIIDANNNAGTDTINFSIGSGEKTIVLLSALPTITDPVVIDGTTQPGYAGKPIIELNGSNAGSGANGLLITAGSSIVHGLVINRFDFEGSGILLRTNGNNVIQGNYIGTDITGTTDLGNSYGIRILHAPNNVIGGVDSSTRNIISGNGRGLEIQGRSAEGNLVQGNYIGTDASGTTNLGNSKDGILLMDVHNTAIGGKVFGAGNLISSNEQHGISLYSSPFGNGTVGNIVQGNYIGSTANGTSALGNQGSGVYIDGATSTTIGGSNGGSNTIAYNSGAGVTVLSHDSHAIIYNKIFSNQQLGINLNSNYFDDDGVTPNDLGDLDGGPNNLQNFPVLTSASSGNGNSTVSGTLNSIANTSFTIQFFSNAVCDPSSGFGEGQTFVGAMTVTTDGNGNTSFVTTLPNSLPEGQFLTATATGPINNTSEFSRCLPVGGNNGQATVYAVRGANQLVRFNSDTPDLVTVVGTMSVPNGETVLGIDFRTATGQLYALGSTSRLYTINPATGAATAVGSGPFSPALDGTTFGFESIPVADRLRIVSNTGQNLRLNPDTGTVTATDASLAYADDSQPLPRIVGAAYTNNDVGATSTSLYVIDATRDVLALQGGMGGTPSPNTGQLTTIGALNIDANDLVGFDISQSGIAYLAIAVPGASTSQFCIVNITTGRATMQDVIGGTESNIPVRAIAVQTTTSPQQTPTVQPTVQPTTQPTTQPTAQPTTQPTTQPTVQPTTQPTAQSTTQPTTQPTVQPTAQSTIPPAATSTSLPSVSPSVTVISTATATIVTTQQGGQHRVYLPLVQSEIPTVIPETTEVLTDATTDLLTDVSEDLAVLTFSKMTRELADLNPGDVVVADVSTNAPYGLLRKVESRTEQGGQVVVRTTGATLEEAIGAGSVTLDHTLVPTDVQRMEQAAGVNFAPAAAPQVAFSFSLNGVVLYDADNNLDTKNDQVRANGSVTIEPSMHLEWDFRFGRLQHFEYSETFVETTEIEIEAPAKVSLLDVEKVIAQHYLSPITVVIGPVPIVLVPVLTLAVAADGSVEAGIRTGVTLTTSFTAGIRYNGSEWSPIGKSQVDYAYDPPTVFGSLTLKAGPKASAGLLLYGLVGPEAVTNAFLELTGRTDQTPRWQLHAGLEVSVEVDMTLLSDSITVPPFVPVQARKRLWVSSDVPSGSVTMRVSLASDGAQGNRESYQPALSADGRLVAFYSSASNLAAGDMNGAEDVFVHDRQTGQTTRVSQASARVPGLFDSGPPALSANGRFVAFFSNASNLVVGDTNNAVDVFIHDRQTGQITRVSQASNGAQSNGYSAQPALSADGRYVAFWSNASNLVVGDTNNAPDVFIHDRQTGRTTRVSQAPNGVQSNDNSYQPALSADGRFVTFSSVATNLVAGDTNNFVDVFIHDRQTGHTTRISQASNGAQSNGGSAQHALSADGRFVAFYSGASNLVAGDTNGATDVFVHDRQTGQTTRVSQASEGSQGPLGSGPLALSADGRFVAFFSYASNLVAGDTNGAPDIFVHDRQTGQTTRVSQATDGAQGNSYSISPALSADGRFVAFESAATTLVAGDTNGAADVFVHDRGSAP